MRNTTAIALNTTALLMIVCQSASFATPTTVNSKPLATPAISQSKQYSTAVNSVVRQAQQYANDLTVAAARASILQSMAATQARAQNTGRR